MIYIELSIISEVSFLAPDLLEALFSKISLDELVGV
jgi:hypothetical protein